MDCTGLINKNIARHIETISLIQNDSKLLDEIDQISKIITNCFEKGGRVYFCGNGGSAADAQHLAAEFSGRFYIDRACLPSEALHCNSSYLTAVANDYSYDLIYSRLISGIGSVGDVLVGITTSGNSANIVNAFNTAHEKGMTTIAMTGNGGGKLKEIADRNIIIPSNDTPRIQEAHILVGHILCEIVEKNIFGEQ